MKRMLVLATMFGALLALTVGASADAGARLRVNVPFAFYVDKDLLQAGEYVFEMRGMSSYAASSSSVLVRKDDGTIAAWIATMPAENPVSRTGSQLVFNQYGEKYFLSKVECVDYKANFRMAKAEKEMRAHFGKSGTTTLVAAKQR